jgi:hypothetical protein
MREDGKLTTPPSRLQEAARGRCWAHFLPSRVSPETGASPEAVPGTALGPFRGRLEAVWGRSGAVWRLSVAGPLWGRSGAVWGPGLSGGCLWPLRGPLWGRSGVEAVCGRSGDRSG